MTKVATRDKGSRRGGPTGQGKVSYSETWTVKGCTSGDDQDTVVIIDPIPQIGDVYLSGTVSKLDATETDNVAVWKVHVTAESTGGGGGTKNPDNSDPDPKLWLPEYSYGVARYKRVLSKDILDAKPILNSAGEPFESAYEEDVIHPTFSVTRYEASTIDVTDLQARYVNHNNLTQFGPFLAKAVLCSNISGSSYYQNNFACMKMTYEFEVDEENLWMLSILDQGRSYLIDNPNSPPAKLRIVAKDDYNVSHGRDVLLDGEGGKLSREDAEAGNVEYLRFNRVLPVSFVPLNIL